MSAEEAFEGRRDFQQQPLVYFQEDWKGRDNVLITGGLCSDWHKNRMAQYWREKWQTPEGENAHPTWLPNGEEQPLLSSSRSILELQKVHVF